MGRARISTPPPRRGGRGKGGAVPDHPQRQHAAGEGDALAASAGSQRRGCHGRLGIHTRKLPPVLIYLFLFPPALLTPASEHKKAAHQGRSCVLVARFYLHEPNNNSG
nr:MAG TPA: hypothetical protein [Caudoviricetes sp.]